MARPRAIQNPMRGAPSLFGRLGQVIIAMRKEQHRTGVAFPIIIKPTVTVVNFRHLPDLADWASAIGASAVQLQPVQCWSSETHEHL